MYSDDECMYIYAQLPHSSAGARMRGILIYTNVDLYNVYKYACMYIRIYIHIRVCVYGHKYIYTYMYVHTSMYIKSYKHLYIYIHI